MKKFDLDQIILEIMSKIILDYTHDIPYLAGYNKDGSIIYIDKDCPFFYKEYPVYKLLLIHMFVEKREINKGTDYDIAHNIAKIAEQTACTAIGLQWEEYDDFMQKQIKNARHRNLENLPHDLDLTPYTQEKDFLELKNMFSGKVYH